ncbi:MAG: hypothetical protein ACF8TS_04515, partial [Maioricimonas sp. JB049]
MSRTIDFGHLFVSGEYVPPPYEVTYDNQELRINGIAIPVASARDVSIDDDNDSLSGGDGPGGRRRARYPRDVLTIVRGLESEHVVAAFPGAAPETLGGDPVFQLLAAGDRSMYVDGLLQILSPAADRELWTDWLLNYEPPPDLVSYASAWVSERDVIESGNWSEINAIRRLDQFAYPLSVFGMIIGAMSVGHLLS